MRDYGEGSSPRRRRSAARAEASELAPVGSRVRSITFFYKSGPASDFIGELWRRQFAAGTSKLIVTTNPSNNAGTPTSVTRNIADVNQPVTADRAYGVGVCPGTDGTFLGARIKYTYTSAGS